MGQGHSAVATSERKRLVFIGLGDAALYTISQLYDLKHRAFDIVAVTPRPALDSGQDLGLRLTNLDLMRKYAKMAEYSQLPQLDAVTIVHGLVTAVDDERKTIMIQRADGTSYEEAYDALVVATGVRNSFWQPNTISALESRFSLPLFSVPPSLSFPSPLVPSGPPTLCPSPQTHTHTHTHTHRCSQERSPAAESRPGGRSPRRGRPGRRRSGGLGLLEHKGEVPGQGRPLVLLRDTNPARFPRLDAGLGDAPSG